MDMYQHPAVDWTRERKGPRRRQVVPVTCPVCGVEREVDAPTVRSRIRNGTFTARCGADRGIGNVRTNHPRLPWLPHPAIDFSRTVYVETDWAARDRPNPKRTRMAPVTCPKCGQERLVQAGVTAWKIRVGKFTGMCLGCSKNAPKREWKLLSPGRKIDPVKGYIRVSAEGLLPGDRVYYDTMRGRTTFILEHRLVMARQIGRPLTSHELVDHMDGIKTNNDPANLRLYVRGRQMPGDHSGGGTFYHEWQTAEGRVRTLEYELGRLRG